MRGNRMKVTPTSGSRIGTLALALVLAFAVAACAESGESSDSTSSAGGDSTTLADGSESPTTAAGGGEACTPEWVDGVLQPLPSGFPSEPITLINVDEAGSNGGIYVRSLQLAIEEAGLSPVDVRISDEPRAQGGSIHALADVYSDREGGDQGYALVHMTIAGTATDFHVEPITEETGLELEDINFFIATDLTPYVLMTRLDAPWGSDFDSFIEYARENGQELSHLTIVGNFNSIAGEWMLAQFGIDPIDVPVVDRQQSNAAIAAGEADFTFTQAAAALQAEGRSVVLWVAGFDVPPAFPDAVGLDAHADYGVDAIPLGTSNGFMVHNDVPDENVCWLHALISAAAEQDVYLDRESTIPGLTVEVLSTEEANALALTAYTDFEQVIRDLGFHVDDQ